MAKAASSTGAGTQARTPFAPAAEPAIATGAEGEGPGMSSTFA